MQRAIVCLVLDCPRISIYYENNRRTKITLQWSILIAARSILLVMNEILGLGGGLGVWGVIRPQSVIHPVEYAVRALSLHDGPSVSLPVDHLSADYWCSCWHWCSGLRCLQPSPSSTNNPPFDSVAFVETGDRHRRLTTDRWARRGEADCTRRSRGW